MNVGSLFSGIGGIDLGLERAGMHVAWQCEIDAYCRGILAKHWPDTPCYGDVRSIDATAPRVDVLAGGFPCQPVSLAGKGLAQADERWLWPEFARLIRLLRPRYVIAENVPGLLTRGLDIVLADLAALRFDAEWTVFGARDVGAPHKRDRVWIVAWDRMEDPDGSPLESRWRGRRAPETGELPDPDMRGRNGSPQPDKRTPAGLEASLGRDPDGLRLDVADADDSRCNGRPGEQRPGWRREPANGCQPWPTEPSVGRVAHGVPQRVDRLRALGNAVVPACAEHIGRLVMEMNS